MEGSCTDEGSTTSDAVSLPPPPPAEVGGAPLYRMGSGGSASVVLDPPAADVDQQAESSSSKKLPSSKYKGVVPQPNGRWGAQIYEKHSRVWLGTFNDEHEAARSYDVAAQRFRGRDAVLNFAPLSDSQSDAVELSFLSSHSKPEIVDMLRKHTYSDELHQARRLSRLHPGPSPQKPPRSGAKLPLFEKTVTPSDVGKLNRLVIPKQHAEKHFPLDSDGKGVLLNFEDADEKVWRFRYSYWNSSQSYVLTKGWSRFVKDKSLAAGDVVVFLRSTAPGDSHQLYIDCRSTAKTTTSAAAVLAATSSIRLFGVEIKSGEEGDGDGNGNGNGKRGGGEGVVLDLDLVLSLDYSNNKRMRMATAELS